jgi:hypothetical protein
MMMVYLLLCKEAANKQVVWFIVNTGKGIEPDMCQGYRHIYDIRNCAYSAEQYVQHDVKLF